MINYAKVLSGRRITIPKDKGIETGDIVIIEDLGDSIGVFPAEVIKK